MSFSNNSAHQQMPVQSQSARPNQQQQQQFQQQQQLRATPSIHTYDQLMKLPSQVQKVLLGMPRQNSYPIQQSYANGAQPPSPQQPPQQQQRQQLFHRPPQGNTFFQHTPHFGSLPNQGQGVKPDQPVGGFSPLHSQPQQQHPSLHFSHQGPML
jgi:hypothetical protein